MTNLTHTSKPKNLYITVFWMTNYGKVRPVGTYQVTECETYEINQTMTYRTTGGEFGDDVSGNMYQDGLMVECIVHTGPECPDYEVNRYFSGWSVFRK